MQQHTLIDETIAYVRETLSGAEGGHDWWHIHRVWKNAKKIAAGEQANLLVVELGALLHDIADAKFHNGDEEKGPQMARTFLHSKQVDEAVIAHVENIIRHISFKGGNEATVFRSIS
jgi:uncharacterized protein